MLCSPEGDTEHGCSALDLLYDVHRTLDPASGEARRDRRSATSLWRHLNWPRCPRHRNAQASLMSGVRIMASMACRVSMLGMIVLVSGRKLPCIWVLGPSGRGSTYPVFEFKVSAVRNHA